jgi:hypothetical protein
MTRRPRNLQARREFAALLDAHLKRGQRADIHLKRWKPWTNSDFAGMVGVDSDRTVANWRNPDVPSPPTDILSILDVLFGDCIEFSGHRRDLNDTWIRAKGLAPNEESSIPSGRWDPVSSSATPIAEVVLRQPAPGNSLNSWHLSATLRFDVAEHIDEQDRTVFLSVTEAFVGVAGSGYQVAALAGEASPIEFIRPGPGGITISAPPR